VGDLLDSAHKLALAEVKPSQFTVGGHFDGKTVTGGVSYDRRWQNGWGLTAYMKAYWTNAPVIPQKGVTAGVEASLKF